MEFYPQLAISHLDRRESSKMGFFHVLAVRFGALQGWEVEPGREGEVDGPVLFGQGNCGAGSVTNVSAEGPSDLSPLSPARGQASCGFFCRSQGHRIHHFPP